MMQANFKRVWGLHLAVLAVLGLLHFVLPDYDHGNFAKIMVLAVFATGFNVLFGYTGLLSLGHAMFFGAGIYGAGLTMDLLGWGPPAAFLAGAVAGLALSAVIGLLALRTTGVAFLIVTMMFGQVAYLATFYFSDYTRGEDGFAIPQAERQVELFGSVLDLTDPGVRYFVAWVLFSICLLGCLALVRSSAGRVLVAIRENEPRTRLLGYGPYWYKFGAMAMSGLYAGMSGAAMVVLFGYAGASFSSIQYSIYPLLWVLVGGAGTVLGPLLGALLMFYLVDTADDFTSAYLLFVGVALVALILFAPKGALGWLRARRLRWLP